MNEHLKHFSWSVPQRGQGRIAVNTAGSVVHMRILTGNGIPAGLLVPILHHALGGQWAHDLWHDYRRNALSCGLEIKHSQYGGISYIVRERKDDDWNHFPIALYLRVSGVGKINEGFYLPKLYLPVVLPPFMEEHIAPRTYTINDVTPGPWDLESPLVTPQAMDRFLSLIEGQVREYEEVYEWFELKEEYLHHRHDPHETYDNPQDVPQGYTGAPHEDLDDSNTWGLVQPKEDTNGND